MIPNPRRLNPAINRARHARAQRRVLWLMANAGYLGRQGLGAEPPPVVVDEEDAPETAETAAHAEGPAAPAAETPAPAETPPATAAPAASPSPTEPTPAPSPPDSPPPPAPPR
jgi:hypothetical protein